MSKFDEQLDAVPYGNMTQMSRSSAMQQFPMCEHHKILLLQAMASATLHEMMPPAAIMEGFNCLSLSKIHQNFSRSRDTLVHSIDSIHIDRKRLIPFDTEVLHQYFPHIICINVTHAS